MKRSDFSENIQDMFKLAQEWYNKKPTKSQQEFRKRLKKISDGSSIHYGSKIKIPLKEVKDEE